MTERLQADIVVVGGSIAGLATAITAKEQDPQLSVLIVEKYTSGYSGKANRGAGIVLLLGEHTPEEFAQFYLKHIGLYLNNQKTLLKYASMLNSNVEAIDKWSGKVDKDENGKFRTLKWGSKLIGHTPDGKAIFDQNVPYPWTLAAIDLDYIREVRRYARRVGVKFVDRVGVVDLLTHDGAAAGVVGYNIDTGEQYVIGARAVVLACGNQCWRIMPMWSPARGEGIAAAFRAGAKLANCEYGSFYNWTSLDHFESHMGVEYALYNDKGENVGIKHVKEVHPDINADSIAEWYKQMVAGNGPMHYREEENPLMPMLTSVLGSQAVHNRPYADRFWNYLFFNAFTRQSSDVVVPGLVGEFGGLWVDENMATPIPGLFAAGDICVLGSRVWGATAQPGRHRGSGIAFATFSGRVAGPSAAAYAAEQGYKPLSDEQIAQTDARFTAPLRSKGKMKPLEMVAEIQKVMQPVGNSLYRHEERMKKALARVIELQGMVPELKAEDPHQLFGVNECVATLLCAEMFFKASLERKESLGWFLREDYPEPSKEGLYWLVVENKNGEVSVSKERVPLEEYPFQPETA
ncbi:MAG: FAD-dependent oxidoreductase [Thermoleophilia bacterium]|nr:FAD-dependent oxidoreductase [Thermoleophilia bacterium]